MLKEWQVIAQCLGVEIVVGGSFGEMGRIIRDLLRHGEEFAYSRLSNQRLLLFTQNSIVRLCSRSLWLQCER